LAGHISSPCLLLALLSDETKHTEEANGQRAGKSQQKQ